MIFRFHLLNCFYVIDDSFDNDYDVDDGDGDAIIMINQLIEFSL